MGQFPFSVIIYTKIVLEVKLEGTVGISACVRGLAVKLFALYADGVSTSPV